MSRHTRSRFPETAEELICFFEICKDANPRLLKKEYVGMLYFLAYGYVPDDVRNAIMGKTKKPLHCPFILIIRKARLRMASAGGVPEDWKEKFWEEIWRKERLGVNVISLKKARTRKKGYKNKSQ